MAKRLIEIEGISKTREEWCKFYGISSAAVTRRMQRKGLTEVEALTLDKGWTEQQIKDHEFYSRSRPDVAMRMVPEYPHLYATEDGRIWNDKRRKFLEGCQLGEGWYWVVNLGTKKEYVHRLVCSAWHLAEEGKDCVDHIDQDKENNHKDNLRWSTYSENSLNHKRNLFIVVGGEEVLLVDHLKRCGIEVNTKEYKRVVRRLAEGCPHDKLLDRGSWSGSRRPCRHARMITHFGRTQTTKAWARELGVDAGALRYRVSTGETWQEAIEYFHNKAA